MNIYFEFDKAEITPMSIAVLMKITNTLLTYSAVNLTVIGHTDNIGTREYNKTLSEERAAVVKQFLVNQGIEEYRIQTLGKGASAPMASNDDEINGRELNRRVEFNFSEN